MLLTITTTHAPATDLGYLLHKNPAKCQEFEVSVGKVHVFYPEASAERCTAAMLLDVDPVGMVRGRGGSRGGEGMVVKPLDFITRGREGSRGKHHCFEASHWLAEPLAVHFARFSC
jgi:hypothetical protein